VKPGDPKRITILIADDHPLFRSGVRGELEQDSRFLILAEVGDGEEAYRQIQALHPDVAILDFQMPTLNGLEITRKLDASGITTRIILLTMHCDKKIFYAALDAGVYGYVLKDDAVADIVQAVTVAAAGEHFISKGLTQLLIEKAKGGAPSRSANNIAETLTPIERKIFSLVADLNSNDEIAGKLFISKRTVENHKSSIADKLGLGSSRNLLRFALQNKDAL